MNEQIKENQILYGTIGNSKETRNLSGQKLKANEDQENQTKGKIKMIQLAKSKWSLIQ